MRQWHISPKCLCRQHLLGEHLEHHMFLGSLKKKRSVKGYIDNKCLIPVTLNYRHDDLVKEMILRGFNHKTPLDNVENYLDSYMFDVELSYDYLFYSVLSLASRCHECFVRLSRYFEVPSHKLVTREAVQFIARKIYYGFC